MVVPDRGSKDMGMNGSGKRSAREREGMLAKLGVWCGFGREICWGRGKGIKQAQLNLWRDIENTKSTSYTVISYRQVGTVICLVGVGV